MSTGPKQMRIQCTCSTISEQGSERTGEGLDLPGRRDVETRVE